MALEAGFTYRQVEHRVATGAWRRLHRGVYAAGTHPTTWPMRLRAVLLARPGGVVSHGSAARLWRVPGFLDHSGLSVTVAPPGGTRLAGVRVHETTLADLDRAEVAGMPVTSPARTIADLAMHMRTPALLAIAGEACRAQRVDVTDLAARVVPRRRGAARLREVVETLGGRGVGASGAEDRFAELLAADPALDGFRRNVLWRLSNGRRTEFDVAWLPERVVDEYDGRSFHSLVVDRADDAARDAAARADGFDVRRWGAEAFAVPDLVVADARTRLAEARHRLAAGAVVPATNPAWST